MGFSRCTIALLAAGTFILPAAARAQDVECDPGERGVRSLDFRGNTAFTDGELALRVVTTPSSWTRRTFRAFGTRRCLDSSELERDVYRVKLLYRNAGFYGAAIDTLVTPAGREAVRVAFLIDEGAPIRIDSVSITGLDSVPERQQVVRNLWIAPGKPFDRARIRSDIDTIITRLRNTGYPRADLLFNYTSDSVAMRATVGLEVLPGARAHISKIVVDAQPVPGKDQEIQAPTVKRLLGVHEGDLYRDVSLAEAQRNLYQTGAYRHVEVQPFPDSLQPPGDSLVVLHVRVLEDYMRELNSELGWATLDCFRTRLQYTDKDFLGGARRLELSGQLSKIAFGEPLSTEWSRSALCYDALQNDPFSRKVNYYAGATLRQPALFGPKIVPTLSLYRERRGEYLAYLRSTLIGGEASLTRNLGRLNTPLRAGYNIEYGRTEAEPALLCAVFNRCDQDSRDQISRRSLPLSIASAAVARVRTDNLVNPTRGSVVRAEVRSSLSFLGSDRSLTFNKGVIDAAWYHRLGWQNVLAVRFRAGGITGGASSGGVRLPPPQERLYAGGPTSVRGFQQNELGALVYITRGFDSVFVNDSTRYYVASDSTGALATPERVVPVGGNSLIVANVEYRIPGPIFPNLLQTTLFADVGEVWTRGAGSKRFGFQQLKWTPGVAVRVFSPVGPIQVNLGYNPYNRPAGPAFFDAPVNAVTGSAPLYCVTPGNTIPVHLRNGQWIQEETQTCPSGYLPAQRNNFLSRLVFTFSIGPDF